MEYECYDLDLDYNLHHGDNPKLMETNRLDEACAFVYQRWNTTGIPCAVYQPRIQSYREIYKPRPHDRVGRAKNGRFKSPKA